MQQQQAWQQKVNKVLKKLPAPELNIGDKVIVNSRANDNSNIKMNGVIIPMPENGINVLEDCIPNDRWCKFQHSSFPWSMDDNFVQDYPNSGSLVFLANYPDLSRQYFVLLENGMISLLDEEKIKKTKSQSQIVQQSLKIQNKLHIIDSFINLVQHPQITVQDYCNFVSLWFRTQCSCPPSFCSISHLNFKKLSNINPNLEFKMIAFVIEKGHKVLLSWLELSLPNLIKLFKKYNDRFIKFSVWRNPTLKSNPFMGYGGIQQLFLKESPEIQEQIRISNYLRNRSIYDNIIFINQYFSSHDPIKILKSRAFPKNNMFIRDLNDYFIYLGIFLFQTNSNFAKFVIEMNISSFEDLSAINIKDLYYFYEKYYLKAKLLRKCAVILSGHGMAIYDNVYVVPNGRTINFKTRSLEPGLSTEIHNNTILSDVGNDSHFLVSYRHSRKYEAGSILPYLNFDPYILSEPGPRAQDLWNFGGFLQLPDCYKSKFEQMYLLDLFSGQSLKEIGKNVRDRNMKKLKDLLFFDKSEEYIGEGEPIRNIMGLFAPGQSPLDIYFDACRVNNEDSEAEDSFKLYEETLELINLIIQKLSPDSFCHQVNLELDQISFQKKIKQHSIDKPKKNRRHSFSTNVQAKTKKCYNLFKLIELLSHIPKCKEELDFLKSNWSFKTRELYYCVNSIYIKIF
jgi:hypothetical protein